MRDEYLPLVPTLVGDGDFQGQGGDQPEAPQTGHDTTETIMEDDTILIHRAHAHILILTFSLG